MARLGSKLASLASLALDHARFSSAVIFIAAALSVFGLTRLGYDDGHESVFSSATQEYAGYLEFTKRYSGSNTNVALLVTAPAVLSKQDLFALQELVLEIHLIDGVEAVFSIFSLQKPDPVDGGYLSIFGEFEEADSVDPLLRQAVDQSFSGMKLVSANLNQTSVIVSLEPGMTNLDLARDALADLDEVSQIAEGNSDLNISVTGLVPVRNWVVEQVRIDQPVINILGAMCGFFISLFIFRSFWIALLNGVASVFALMLSLGLFGLFGFSINVLNTALPVLVLVLASSDCTHITYEFCRQSEMGKQPKEAIRAALLEMISPCALTSLTTAIAFATLYFSPSPIIRELAISGSLCVIGAFFAVLLVHPLVFLVASRFGVVSSALKRPLPIATRSLSTRQFFDYLQAHRRWIVGTGLALSAALAFVMFPIKTSYSFSENINADNPLVATLAELEAFSGPMTTLEIPLIAKSKQEALSTELISEIETIHTTLEEQFADFPVVSLHTISRFIEDGGKQATPDMITELMELLPEKYLNRIVSTTGDGYLLSMMVPDLGAEKLRLLTARVDRELAAMPTQLLSIQPVTGMLALSSQLSDQMIRQLMISFLTVALLCPLLIGLWFGELKFVWIAFLPNLLPILAIGAWMMTTGHNVQFTSALAMTIAFGIAVDDTIHVFNRISHSSKASGGVISPQALSAAMTHVSPALATTTFILMSGLIVVLWSEMPMIQYFGLLCVSTFALALVADIVLLPAIAAMVFATAKDRVRVSK